MNTLATGSLGAMAIAILVFTLLVIVLSALVLLARTLVSGTSAYQITLNNHSIVETDGHNRLLQVLNEAGIPVPSGCAGAGTCGLCKVKIADNRTKPTPSDRARLNRSELREGVRLACQVRVRENLSVSVPKNILSADKWDCHVIAVRQLSPLIKEITLELPESASFAFQPGGYVQITAPAYQQAFTALPIEAAFKEQWNKLDTADMVAETTTEVTRAYSLANKPEQQSMLVVLIRLALPPPALYHKAPPGAVSTWLFSRTPGDKVRVEGPFGDFQLHPSEREMVLIGGGVGMAPLRSILHEELHSNRGRSVHFFYGARSQWDIFYEEEMAQLVSRFPNFKFDLVLSEPSNELPWNGSTGFVHEVLQKNFLAPHSRPEECDYYLCGPPLMQQAVIAALDDAGVEPHCIFADSFG